jgi:NAD-dependent deacetylase
LQREFRGRVTLVTQNVDDLHERAGSPGVIHMHGELIKARCTHCDYDSPWEGDMETTTPCPVCRRTGGMRPDIVWFGEIPYHMDRIESVLEDASLFVAIGTSGHVYPAAGFVTIAKFAGAETIEINNAQTQVSGVFGTRFTGAATVEVPKWVDGLLSGSP